MAKLAGSSNPGLISVAPLRLLRKRPELIKSRIDSAICNTTSVLLNLERPARALASPFTADTVSGLAA